MNEFAPEPHAEEFDDSPAVPAAVEAVPVAGQPANHANGAPQKPASSGTRRRTSRFRAGDIRRRLGYERVEALDTRDPIAIRFAGERYEVIRDALADLPDEARIDPWAVTIGVSQAARVLGFNGREIRSLIRLGRLPARKVRNEWRIPLEAVL